MSYGVSNGHYLRASAAGDLPQVTTMTACGWVKLSNNTNILQPIVSLARDCCGTYYGFDLFANKYDATAKPCFQIWNGSGAAVVHGTTLSTGQWYHIAASYDGSTLRLYLDGGSPATASSAIGIGNPYSYPITLGALAHDVGYTLIGDLAEVAIWNATLTQGEIVSLSKGFRPTKIRPSGLVLYQDLIRSANRPGIGPTLTAVSPVVAVHPRVIQ